MAERRIINGYIVEKRDDGSIVTIGPADAQPQQVMAGNPYAAPQAEADISKTQTSVQGQQIGNRVAAGTAPTTIQTNQAPAGYMWINPSNPAQGVLPIPGYVPEGQQQTAATKEEKAGRASRLNQLIGQINRVQTLYDQSVGKTKGLKGVIDSLPTDANARFDAAGAALSQQGLAAFRVPGTGTVSDRDAIMFDRANLPTADTRDTAIEEQLRGLRARVNEEYKTLGLAAPQWQGELAADEREQLGSVWSQNTIVNGGGPGAAAAGASQQSIPIDPEYQAEYAAFLNQWAANPDPNAYVAKRIELDRKYGYGSDIPAYTDWATTNAERFKQGGATVNSQIPGINAPLEGMGALRNDLVNNPLGAAVAGAADMGLFGIPSALAGEQMQALGDANPYSMMGGQVLGSIAGAGALGKAGGSIFGKIAPQLLGGGAKAKLARDVATDAAYSGIYGGVTEGDPLGSAASGTVGSLAGNAVGKVAGAALGGVALSPAAQYLRSREIPMTLGQKLGGAAKALEDKATSIPFVGDMVNARRSEGLQAFNRAAMVDAGKSIGYTPGNIGKEGVQELLDATSSAYDNATAGVTVPFDARFASDLTALGRMRDMLPPDYASRFDQIIRNRVGPLVDAGQMTGSSYQQAMRGLKGSRSSASGSAPGFESEMKAALGGAMDTLTGQMQRGGGDRVVAGLADADMAYRNTKTLGDAVDRAAGGSMSGENYLFTPSQLQRASMASAKKYPGARPFEQLADAGQEVLPSRIPDSGTAGRAAQMLLPGALVGGAGGAAGYAAGGQEGAQTGGMSAAALAALLALGGTRGGQKALDLALVARPDALNVAGRYIQRHRGLFGSGAIPLALGSQ